MKVKCDYCDNYYDDTLNSCPFCGAPNEYVRTKDINHPQTIEDFIEWYERNNLPSFEVTRFFIGINYPYPKAFGIYKDSQGICTVYKNKADGSRAIRYQGYDEAFAVNELFQRLKAEIADRKSRIRR